MKTLLLTCLILLLAGCGNRTDKGALIIAEQGSFAVGGTVLKDSLGRSFHGDHAYVFYQKPVDARKYPLVFAHGVGQFSKTWETTPDGREGFQNIFLRKGFPVYLVDQRRRGNAGRSTETATISPAFDEELWFNRFRVGIWPDYFEGVQFSRDPEALNQYFRQMTPTIGTIDFEVYADAYAALFDKIGPAVFVTHSQGGPVGWQTLLKTKNIKGIVSYEPGGGIPFPRRASAGRRQSADPLEEDGRHRGADGRVYGMHPNPHRCIFWRQPARNGRASRNLRMDAPPPPDAPVGEDAQRLGRGCDRRPSARSGTARQHALPDVGLEQRGGGGTDA